MKLTDLKDLRVIKKSLEPEPEPKPQQNQPRKRSVELKSKEEPVFEDNTGDLTVDLHIERIPGSDGIPEWAALDFQMNYFRQVLRKNLKHRGRRLIFIPC